MLCSTPKSCRLSGEQSPELKSHGNKQLYRRETRNSKLWHTTKGKLVSNAIIDERNSSSPQKAETSDLAFKKTNFPPPESQVMES